MGGNQFASTWNKPIYKTISEIDVCNETCPETIQSNEFSPYRVGVNMSKVAGCVGDHLLPVRFGSSFRVS